MIRYTLLILLSLVSLQTHGQTNFSSNVVKKRGGEAYNGAPVYGFIIGNDPQAGKFYFVMIYKKDQQRTKEISICYTIGGTNKNLAVRQAILLDHKRTPIPIGKYVFALYEAEGTPDIKKGHFSTNNFDESKNYQPYGDYSPNNTNDLTPAKCRYTCFIKPNQTNKKNKTISFMSERSTGQSLVFAGLPITDAAGNLAGIAATNEEHQTFEVIDILFIKEQLLAIPGESDCKYFNLIPQNYVATECERAKRDVIMADSLRKVRERIEEARSKFERNDDNLLIDIGLNAGAGGNIAPTYYDASFGWGYYGGISVFIRPDTGFLRFSVTPEYRRGNFGLLKLSDKVIEVPGLNTTQSLYNVQFEQYNIRAMVEMTIDHDSYGHNYIGLGYSQSFKNSTHYTLENNEGNHTTYPLNFRKNAYQSLIFEYGRSAAKWRTALSISYLLNSPFKSNDEVMIPGDRIKPFFNVKPYLFYIGLDFTYRIFGHWQNSKRY